MWSINNVVLSIKNNFKVIAVLILIVGSFYWFELRPSMIKKYCSSFAVNISLSADQSTYDQKTYNGEYKRCTEMKGL